MHVEPGWTKPRLLAPPPPLHLLLTLTPRPHPRPPSRHLPNSSEDSSLPRRPPASTSYYYYSLTASSSSPCLPTSPPPPPALRTSSSHPPRPLDSSSSPPPSSWRFGAVGSGRGRSRRTAAGPYRPRQPWPQWRAAIMAAREHVHVLSVPPWPRHTRRAAACWQGWRSATPPIKLRLAWCALGGREAGGAHEDLLRGPPFAVPRPPANITGLPRMLRRVGR